MEIITERMDNSNDDVEDGKILWISSKFGFKIAYAIKLNNQNWWIKKPNVEWERRSSDWVINDENSWRKLIINMCTN